MSHKLRCFIALDLPKEAINELKNVQKEIEKQNLFIGKFTEEDNVHLTLKFLGSIDKEKVSAIQTKLRKVSFKKFNAIINELGVFSEEFVRIIWVTLNGDDVFELQSFIDHAVLDFFPREERFMSHITLARVKSLEDKGKLIEYLNRFKLQAIRAEITSFSLITSELRPEGPKFTVIEKYKLK